MRKLLTLSVVLGAAVAAILSPGLAQNVVQNSITTENIVTYLGTQTFSDVIGKVTNQTGTTYTLALSDCGTEVAFTNASAVTVTIPATLFAGCNIAIYQAGAGQVSMTGSAVTPATRISAHSYSKTFGQGAIIGINIPAVGTAVITGDGA
jgi:predicted ATP-dependent Lon-type protease